MMSITALFLAFLSTALADREEDGRNTAPAAAFAPAASVPPGTAVAPAASVPPAATVPPAAGVPTAGEKTPDPERPAAPAVAGAAEAPTSAVVAAGGEPSSPAGEEPTAVAVAPVPTTQGPAAGSAKSDDTLPLTFGARVHARYTVDQPSSSERFDLRRVRFFSELRPAPWLYTQVEIDALEVPSVRDAFVTAVAHDAFGVTAGRFKKPFSVIELTSSGRLPLVRRGLMNDRVVGGLGLGGRDLGVMVHGDLGRLEYSAGAFNGNPTLGDSDFGGDLAGRLEWKPRRRLRLGASGASHASPVAAGDRAWAASADARLRVEDFEGQAELMWARPSPGDALTGAMVYGLVHLRPDEALEVAPIVKLEVLDDPARADEPSWSALAGCNLRFGGPLRLMVQGELLRSPDYPADSLARLLFVQLAFDYELPLGLATETR